MPSYRTYRYMVRSSSQAEKDSIEIRARNMKAARAEFKRRYPQIDTKEIICRKYNEGDRVSEEMGSELQGCL